MPDPLSIANCVAEQAREPSAEELLSNRASSLTSNSTASPASLFSNVSQPALPMLHDLSALMPWKKAGQPNVHAEQDGQVQPGARPSSGHMGNANGHLGHPADAAAARPAESSPQL
jgi:hypothetical protein